MAMELADLHVFVTAVAVGSLSAAARELRVAQPSASERLRRLERLVRRGAGGRHREALRLRRRLHGPHRSLPA
ncbi:LysR family transcriptional regulator, partial [Streptomyces xanthochromogenes]